MHKIAEILASNLTDREAGKLIDLRAAPRRPMCRVTEALIELKLVETKQGHDMLLLTPLGEHVLTILLATTGKMPAQRAA